MTNTDAIVLKGITKRFGNTVANDKIDLSVKQGEVHALIGENGAGKSTLMNILYGMFKPDEGQIYVNGELCNFNSPRDSIIHGIGMVHQHFMLSPSLTVAENISLGHPPTNGLLWKPKILEEKLKEYKNIFKFDVSLDTVTSDLSVGMMQRVEIIKTLYRGAKVIILDEPTAVLTPQESDELFITIRRLTNLGHTVIFISHKLKEIMEISDSITVMRAGKVVNTVKKTETTQRDLAQMMIGRDLVGVNPKPVEVGKKVLDITNLVVESNVGKRQVDNISFSLNLGEILGVAGVEGNGQTELTEAILGTRKVKSGEIVMFDTNVNNLPVENRLRLGMAFIPQDRIIEGLALPLTVRDNLILKLRNYQPISKNGLMRWGEVNKKCKELIENYQVKVGSEMDLVSSLSGGNMQKVVVARELSTEPALVIACQPTRGVDIGAAEYIRSMLLKLRDDGNAVLLISADLDEIMELSDRVIVMFEGRKTGELLSKDADAYKLGELMFTVGSDE